MQLWQVVHFQFGKGWEPKLLKMCVAFDWVGDSWVKIGRKVQSVWVYCHASLYICVSVGVSGRWMKVKWYLWHLDVF